MNSPWIWIVVVVAVLGIGIPLALYLRRQNYIKTLEAQGWRFIENPGQDFVYGLNVPPFGMGVRRHVDDVIEGTTSQGVPFRIVEYSTSGSGKNRLALLALSGVHDPAFVAPAGSMRPGAGGYDKGLVGNLSVYTTDPADDALLPAIGSVLPQQLGAVPTNLAIDGSWLTALGCPEKAEEIKPFVEALAPVALAINRLPTSSTWVMPTELAFYGRPDMFYRERDDSFLAQVPHTQGGMNHAAVDVMFSDNAGLPLIALTHTWDTQRTETYTDAQGKTQTRTVTDHHSEGILQVAMPYPFIPIEVRDQGLFGPSHKVQFESIDFDQRFEVGCPNPKFASDVFHPRMMEWILAEQPPPFSITGGQFHFRAAAGSPETVMWCADFVHEFLSRVPSFVWKDLGIAPPAFRPID